MMDDGRAEMTRPKPKFVTTTLWQRGVPRWSATTF